MIYLRFIFLFFIYLVFCIGFTKGIGLRFVKFFTDKELHLIVFSVYPFITYFLLGKLKYKKFIVFFVAFCLPFLIEFVQIYIPYRSFCVTDIKYSLFGSLISITLINYFK